MNRGAPGPVERDVARGLLVLAVLALVLLAVRLAVRLFSAGVGISR